MQASQSATIGGGCPNLTGSWKEAAGGPEGGAQPSEEDEDALGREGLLGRLHRNLSLSLFRLSSITPTPLASRRRQSSVGPIDARAALDEAAKEGANTEGSSQALDALMPFVPLMFRRDLLLPEPTFSTTQVACAFCIVYEHHDSRCGLPVRTDKTMYSKELSPEDCHACIRTRMCLQLWSSGRVRRGTSHTDMPGRVHAIAVHTLTPGARLKSQASQNPQLSH